MCSNSLLVKQKEAQKLLMLGGFGRSFGGRFSDLLMSLFSAHALGNSTVGLKTLRYFFHGLILQPTAAFQYLPFTTNYDSLTPILFC